MVILENSSQSGNYGSQTTSNGNIGGKAPRSFYEGRESEGVISEGGKQD